MAWALSTQGAAESALYILLLLSSPTPSQVRGGAPKGRAFCTRETPPRTPPLTATVTLTAALREAMQARVPKRGSTSSCRPPDAASSPIETQPANMSGWPVPDAWREGRGDVERQNAAPNGEAWVRARLRPPRACLYAVDVRSRGVSILLVPPEQEHSGPACLCQAYLAVRRAPWSSGSSEQEGSCARSDTRCGRLCGG